ncbi:MAG: hypothetical protein IPI67_33265 [Myxococcales bacterium]|nr:hypothetical protein [Myxococcales bacterium]
MSLLVPFGPKLLALDTNPTAVALCKKADALLPPPLVDGLARVTAVAHVNERLLVATGPVLYDLTVTDPSLPKLGSGKTLVHPLTALRADAVGMRAYGVSLSGQQQPIIDLRDQHPSVVGSHNLESWVKRRDSRVLSARVVGEKADLARVVP